MKLKICSICLKEKDISCFYFRKSEGRYRIDCKECCKKRTKNNKKEHNNSIDLTIKTKICKNCKCEKNIFNFGRNKNSKDGFNRFCFICCREIGEKNRRKKGIKQKKQKIKFISAFKICSECKKEKSTRDFYKRKKSKDGFRQECKKCGLRLKFKRHLERIKKDVGYRFLCKFRARTSQLVKGKKSNHTLELLGCLMDDFIKYFESKFYDRKSTGEKMNWENYGIYGWHIDHIIPCASFDLSKPDDQSKCFHYTNLQPLWAEDNLLKSDKMDYYINY